MNFQRKDLKNKEKLFYRVNTELSSEKAKQAVSGFAYHWYTGDHFENLSLIHDQYPNKLLFHTEGCTGFSNFNSNDEIHNGELYAHDIIGDLNHGCNAYIDWNLILDNNGGPNHKSNYCNSPIMLNKENNEYKKDLDRINNNMVDFMVPFFEHWYYTKKMDGSYSIKYVLPALFPDDPSLDYHNLELIHNGGEASSSFVDMKGKSDDEIKRIRKALLEYCKLDTYAMVKIYEKLKEV